MQPRRKPITTDDVVDRLPDPPAEKYPSGRCRICGCTEERPCLDDFQNPCSWIDAAKTLCDNLDCIARVSIGELEKMVPA